MMTWSSFEMVRLSLLDSPTPTPSTPAASQSAFCGAFSSCQSRSGTTGQTLKDILGLF